MSYEILRTVPLFAELPDDDVSLLCTGSEEVRLAAGQELFAEGSPGDKAYVVTEGQLEVVKDALGREVLLNVVKDGDIVGEMALLEDRPRMASVRARTDCVLIAIRKEQMDKLLTTSLPGVRAMFFTVLRRWRETDALLRQSEKMAQLGTLTAGVAHELNNPAAAVGRGTEQLREAAAAYQAACLDVAALPLTDAQRATLRAWADDAQSRAQQGAELDTLARSDRETALETWLDDHGVDDAWELAAPLVDLGCDEVELGGVEAAVGKERLRPVLVWLGATHALFSLLAQVNQGAARLSEIVKALKSYVYLDQAPVQNVDVHEGIDNTLLILRSKLKGIALRRDYDPGLPRIEAYGSELNQVWTNILDNAADALEGRDNPSITIRTRKEGKWVVVGVEDNGPGIPPEIQTRIFDSFFTTKPQGKGTGLGLDITYNIAVNRHKGDIKVFSEPGRTCFEVWLPVAASA